MSKKYWAKGRVKGTHCIRLDDDIYQIVKNKSKKMKITMKEFVSILVKNFNVENNNIYL